MSERIELVITGDAKGLVEELKRAGVQVKTFGDEAGKSGKGAGELGKETDGLASKMAKIAAVVGVVDFIKDFGVASFQAAAQAERLGRATNAMAQNIGTSGDAMVSAITAASQGTISQLDAMTAANKAMMFGLVENGDQMADLTQIAMTLGAAMGQDAAKSMDDLTTALGRQSPMILDNLGITLKMEEAYNIYAASLGKTSEQLTEQEKKQAFVNAALEKGRAKVAELGGVTVDSAAKTEQLAAAWSDFQVAFGGLLTTMTGGVDTLTSWVRNLEEGAKAWQGIFEVSGQLLEQNRTVVEANNAQQQYAYGVVNTASAIQDETTAIQANATAQQEQIMIARGAASAAYVQARATEEAAAAEKAKAAESSRWGGMAETNKQQLDALALGHTMTAEQARLYAEAQREATEAEAARQEALQGLLGSAADYYNSISELQASAASNDANYSAQINDARTSAAEAQKEQAAGLSEELAKLEQERADKIAWVQTGAHARTAAENDAALAHWNAHYDTLIATAQAKGAEETAAIEAERAKREASASAARAKEQAEYQAHLEELKLKTALSMLETTGQLEQMTGLVGIKAGEAAELIKAGLLPVTNELGMAVQSTMGELAAKQEEAAAVATTNQETLKAAFEGSLPAMQGQADMVGVTLPEAMAAGVAGIGDFATKTEEEFGKAAVQVKKFKEDIKKEDWAGLGKAIMQGMAQGIDKNKHLVIEKLKAMVKEAIQTSESELGIHSPSAVYAAMTAQIPAGAALGVERNSGQFQDAISKMFAVKDITNIHEYAEMAGDQVEKFLDGTQLEESRIKMSLSAMKSVFRQNYKEIMGAADQQDAFRKIMRDSNRLDFLGGGDQGKIMDSALGMFINAYNEVVPLAQKLEIENAIASMTKMNSLAGSFYSFATATGGKIKDQLETQLKFATSKEQEAALQQQVLGVETNLADLASQQAQLKTMQSQAQRLDFATKNNLDAGSVLGMSGDDYQYLQQQIGFQSILRQNKLGKFAGQFGLGQGLFDMFGGAGAGFSALFGQYGQNLNPLLSRTGGGQQIHYHLNVNSMDSAGAVRDFRFMEAMAGA